jgi:hypothetical protein
MRIIICALFFAVVGCKSTQNKGSVNELKEFDFQTISKGSLFGDGLEGISESNFTITNGKAWNALKNNMNKENNISSNFKEMSIDFSTEMIVCVFDKVRSTGGISVEIDKIFIENDSTKINYSIKKPAPGEMAVTVVAQPYHIVKTQKSKGVLFFIHTEK